MGVGGGRHDAAAGETIAQQVGEQKRREVIQREGLLEALGGHLARGEQRPGVVREHVDLPVAPAHLLGERAHLGHQHQVGDVLVDRRAAAGRAGLHRDRLHALGVATDERELGAVAGELDRGGAADAAGGAGEQDERHGLDSTPTAASVMWA